MIPLEKIWVLISISIILIILLTDPKSSINGTWSNQISTIFASASEGQKFIKQLSWVLIIMFYVITLSLSYFT